MIRNETSVSIKYEEIYDPLKNYQLLKKDLFYGVG
jgi:hypothetical protein